jgi:hypothetical protein
MDSKLVTVGLAAAVLTLSAPLVSAAVTEYTSSASFDAAVSSESAVNFNGLVSPSQIKSGNVTVGDLHFTRGAGDHDWVIGSNVGLASYGTAFLTSQALDDGNAPSEVVCTLAGGETAIGFTFGDYVDASIPLSVRVRTGSTLSVFSLTTPAQPGVGTGFVGFITTAPISYVTFVDKGDAIDLISVTEGPAGGATSVPEPGPLALMTTGLFSLLLLRRRRAAPVKVRRPRR